jgi:hypothetical protein
MVEQGLCFLLEEILLAIETTFLLRGGYIYVS